MAPNRDPSTGRFVSGSSIGNAVARITVDSSGMVTAERQVATSARNIDASGKQINGTIAGIADQFRQAEAAARAFDKSDLGTIKRGIDAARQSTQLLSAAAAGVVVAGVAAAQNINVLNARFTVFLGSADKAKTALSQIRQIADDTGQPFLELAQTSADLLSASKAYGVSLKDLIGLADQFKAISPTANQDELTSAVKEFAAGRSRSLVSQFGLNPDDLKKITDQGGSAAQQVQLLSKYLNDLGFSGQTLKKLGDDGVFAFKDLQDSIQETIGTAFTPLLKDFIIPGIREFNALLRQLRDTNPELLKFAATGAVIVAGIAPALLILSQLITAYKTLQTVSVVGGLASGAGKILGVGLAAGAGASIGTNVATGLAKAGVRSGDLGRIAGGENANDILGERLKQILVIITAGITQAVKIVAQVLTGGADIIGQGIDLIANVLKLGAASFQVGFGQIQLTIGNLVVGLSDLLRKIPGAGGSADSLEISGLNLQSQGDTAIQQGIAGQNEAITRLQKGIDFSQTQAKIDAVGKTFDDAQNSIVKFENDLLFGGDAVKKASDDAATGLDNVAKSATPLADKIVAAQGDFEEAAKNIKKLKDDAVREQVEIDAQRKLSSAREAFDTSVSQGRADADRIRDASREEADIARSRSKQIAEAMTADNEVEAKGLQHRQELIQTNAEALEQLATDHGNRLKQIQEETNRNVENAASHLDANAVFEALTSGTAAVNQENTSFGTETDKKKAELTKQLADLDTSLSEQRNARLNALTQQFKDEDAQRAITNERKAADLAEQQKRDEDDRTLRINRQNDDYALQDRLRREAITRQINDQIAALADSTGLNQRLVAGVVNGLAAAGGKVTDFVSFVNQQVSQLIGAAQNGTIRGSTGDTGNVTTRYTPTFAVGGNAQLNRPVRVNDGSGMESALIGQKTLALFSQPTQIFNAQQTQQILGGGRGGFRDFIIQNFAPVFNDVGSYSPDDIEGMIRKGIVEAANDVAALQGA